MNKSKLLCWCDSPTVATGFGIVSKNLFRDLHKEYDVFILGINDHALNIYDTTKYFIFPTDNNDILGRNKFAKILKTVSPDKIILFQDIFNIQHVLPIIKETHPNVPILAYFPIDGTPVNQYWKPAFDTPDKLVTYTKWGVNAIYNTFPDLKKKNIEYLYHGVDTNIFNVYPSNVRQRHKRDSGWGDKFLIVSNNRYQPRKALPLSLRAVALFVKGYKICKCGNAYIASKNICDLNGCGEEDVISMHGGHGDVTIYMHAALFEGIIGDGAPSSLASAAINAGFVGEDIPKHVVFFNGNPYENPYSDQQMAELYNVADVNISSTLGEGVGLSLIEAAACGTTSIAPNNSAIPEMLGDTGHIIKNSAHITMSLDNNLVRPIVSISGVINALEIEYQKWLANGRKKVINAEAVQRVTTLFNWDEKRAQLSGWLKEL
jgi:glycosyltransferase involved in cell wall biosynthesis